MSERAGRQEQTAPGLTMSIVGDIRLDIRTTMTEHSFTSIHDDLWCFAPVSMSIGGTAANLARFAVRLFDRVNVVASVAEDMFAPVVAEHLRALGAHAFLYPKPQTRIAATVMVHDRSPAGARGTGARLMLSDPASPNRLLSVVDVTEASGVLLGSDLVFVDGYSMLGEASKGAIEYIVDSCRNASVPVCMDLVPHDLYLHRGLTELAHVIASCDVVIVEAGSLAGFLGKPVSGLVPESVARQVATDVAELFGDRMDWYIRYGYKNMDQVMVCRGGKVIRAYSTGCATATDRSAYGDRVAAAELYCWLTQREVDPAMWQDSSGAGGD